MQTKQASLAWRIAARLLTFDYGCLAAAAFCRGSKRMRPGVSLVAPRKMKSISLVVCSPNGTIRGGLKGLLGFLSLLSK